MMKNILPHFLRVLLVQNRCAVQAQCGTSCSSDNDCVNAPASCTFCVDRRCQQQPFCNSPCTNDYQCFRALQGCTACIGYRCNQPNTPTCGSFCQSDNQCSNARNGCIYCNLNVRQCASQRYVTPSECISDFNGLNNAAIGNSQSVVLCQNSQITLASTITINRQGQNFNLQCQGGTSCFISGSNAFPLLMITANSVFISGITFRFGRSPNNVRTTECCSSVYVC